MREASRMMTHKGLNISLNNRCGISVQKELMTLADDFIYHPGCIFHFTPLIPTLVILIHTSKLTLLFSHVYDGIYEVTIFDKVVCQINRRVV